MVSEKEKSFFDQKAFINVAVHDDIEKPKQEWVDNGKEKGYAWSMPYRVSKGRHDQDTKGNFVTTYDVVFHTDVAHFITKSP